MAQLVEALCYKPVVRGFDSRWGRFDLLLTVSFRSAPGFDTASNRSEYEGYLLGVKAAAWG